ncbi:hypothetical protein F7725_015651 [Dissostichus mawsoni]|uniref:Uncharacterized protein n=1 Tax=Dissostichus mawsoni TaxID=36200 RepID=A0A7J5YI62_DISMA|nr:hypothetical protein F7725_015651 [Dissostichus mawsoni]
MAKRGLFWGGAVLLCGVDVCLEMILIPKCCSSVWQVLWFEKRLPLQHHCLRPERSSVMIGQQKLLSLWVLLLLTAALCPGVNSKRGIKGRGKGDDDDDKAPSSPSKSLSKKGLKWAGAAAAAGMLGGTGTGLGFFGKGKHGSGKHHGHKTSSSEHDQRPHHNENQRFQNHSLWRAFVKSAAPAPTTNICLTLGNVLSFLIAAWIRDF